MFNDRVVFASVLHTFIPKNEQEETTFLLKRDCIFVFSRIFLTEFLASCRATESPVGINMLLAWKHGVFLDTVSIQIQGQQHASHQSSFEIMSYSPRKLWHTYVQHFLIDCTVIMKQDPEMCTAFLWKRRAMFRICFGINMVCFV